MAKKPVEQIRVCVRMRPLLPPYEDEEVWAVDYNENKVFTTGSANFGGALDNNGTP